MTNTLSKTQREALVKIDIREKADDGSLSYWAFSDIGVGSATRRSLISRKLLRGYFPNGQGSGPLSNMRFKLTEAGRAAIGYGPASAHVTKDAKTESETP